MTVRRDSNARSLLSSHSLCYDLFLCIIFVTKQGTISSLVICLLTPFDKIYIRFCTSRPTSRMIVDQDTSIVNKVVSKQIEILPQQHKKKENRLKERTRTNNHFHNNDGFEIRHRLRNQEIRRQKLCPMEGDDAGCVDHPKTGQSHSAH